MIEQMHGENFGVYGARKVHAQLRRQGHPVARCTVERLMRAAGLRGLSRAKGPRTTIQGLSPDLRPDLVGRAFTATCPNHLWVAEITYCRTLTGWAYAAFVTDVYSRRVIGWQLPKSLRTDLTLDAVEMGIWTRRRAGPRRDDPPLGQGRPGRRRAPQPTARQSWRSRLGRVHRELV
ncbi:IS3 family transposase [Modestobacter sp. VKM Ac-2984]|uniref:IS3 family transposase n=1 Tax=Modestobacter sp. VKM Ac-2984 TaxID=3004138 RepID=UPI003FA5C2EE